MNLSQYCLSLFFALVLCNVAAAVGDSSGGGGTPIVVLAGSDQQSPTISNNWIAWQDNRPNDGVFGVRAMNRSGGAEFWVSPSPGSTYYVQPRLSGNTLLFQGNPDAKGVLFFDDLSNPAPYQKVYDQVRTQFAGDIHNNLTVWHEVADTSTSNGDVYGSYLGSNTKFPISTTGNAFINPTTDGRFVLWHEWDSSNQLDLHAKDLQTGISSKLYDSTSPYAEIDNGIAVFAAGGGIQIRNLLTSQSQFLPTSPVYSATIGGDLIVYSTLTPGKSDADLWGMRLSNLQPFLISDAPGDQLWADVSGDFVVWTDGRSGDYDIYGTTVPEPGTMLLVCGAISCGLLVRRRPS